MSLLNRAPNDVIVAQQQRGQGPSHQHQDGAKAINCGLFKALPSEPIKSAEIFSAAKHALDGRTPGVEGTGGDLQLTGRVLFDDGPVPGQVTPTDAKVFSSTVVLVATNMEESIVKVSRKSGVHRSKESRESGEP